MSRALLICVLLLCGSVVTPAHAQVMPRSSGGCAVSASGLMDCDVLSAIEFPKRDSKHGNDATPPVVEHTQAGLFVTRFSLAVGAPLTLGMESYDALVVALNDGILNNETAKPAAPIRVSKGSVMMVPKNEQIRLRNDSGHDLELVVIENRQAQ
jgi:hypothetical protein